MTAPTAERFAALTVVPDGDVHIVGSLHSAEYLAVPEIGATVIRWLQAGESIERCAARAEELAGEPVDVADFVDTLVEHGLLPAGGGDDGTDGADAAGSPGAPGAFGSAGTAAAGWRLVGRVLFHPVAWAVHAALAVAAVLLLVARPELRPHYTDLTPTRSALSSLLLVSLVTVVCILVHEAGHVAAAARLGLRSSLSVSRRLYFVVFQADLTRLWSVPRRQRFGPLLAGMALDAATLGAFLIAQALLAPRLDADAVQILRTLVLVQISGILIQTWIFMRTDLYALFTTATSSRNLWVLKGALLRRWIRRETAADRTTLADATARELRWAKVFVCLYVPGLVYALGYLAYFGIPGSLRILRMAVGAIEDPGLTTLAGWSGVAALVFVFLPASLALGGAARSGLRLLRAATRRRATAGPDA
ncbi:hypothetical protein GA0070606_4727 [Micromonospora citrea]|uniref:Peptide zinc metalloprotease protein n=1 Tax=Micromonospora citrea TaxID=47855 RepID=A0A1C6VPC9_9ACTN|nr:hypothetical protein [Micromonospora citrea]SCL68169.1 hypothetical protein GA0070606_4727 [Micromonospora citrea]